MVHSHRTRHVQCSCQKCECYNAGIGSYFCAVQCHPESSRSKFYKGKSGRASGTENTPPEVTLLALVSVH